MQFPLKHYYVWDVFGQGMRALNGTINYDIIVVYIYIPIRHSSKKSRTSRLKISHLLEEVDVALKEKIKAKSAMSMGIRVGKIIIKIDVVLFQCCF
jgi:hypothetical protein